MKIPSWAAPLAVGVIMAMVVMDLVTGVRHAQLTQSGDSLDTAVDSLAALVDSMRRDTVVVTSIVRVADSTSHRARQVDTSATLWRNAFEAEHAARLLLADRVAIYRDVIVPGLQGQVATAQRQRDAWRKVARPSLFSFKRIRPALGCMVMLSGGAGCGAGIAYSF